VGELLETNKMEKLSDGMLIFVFMLWITCVNNDFNIYMLIVINSYIIIIISILQWNLDHLSFHPCVEILSPPIPPFSFPIPPDPLLWSLFKHGLLLLD
jgi:hypothetical protein